MKICTKCNISIDDNMSFCPSCGETLKNFQPVTVTMPSNSTDNPPAKKPHLALKIVSMALSIDGFALMVIGALYTFIFSMAELGLGDEGKGMALFMAFIFSFYAPFSIVGLCLSYKCINQGDTSAMSKVGKNLGLAGVILAAAIILTGLLTLLA